MLYVKAHGIRKVKIQMAITKLKYDTIIIVM